MSGKVGFNIGICIDDIPKEYIKKAKNGKRYLNLNGFLSDESDKFEQNGSVTLPQTKEQMQAKERKVYVGNLKLYYSNEEPLIYSKPEPVEVEDDYDLPF